MSELLQQPPSVSNTLIAQRDLIVGCLARIRRRLFGVRLAERLTLALAWGAAVGAVLTAARLLGQWNPLVAAAVALLPVIAATWLWMRTDRVGRRVAGLSPLLARIAAVLTAAACTAMIVLLGWKSAGEVPVWSIPAATAALFLIAAAASVRLIDARAAAIFVDQQVGLRERVSTALELLATTHATDMERAFHAPVIASAVNACQEVRTARVGYQRMDSRIYALAALAAITAAALTLLHPLPAPAHVMHKTTVAVAPQVKQLQQVIKELEEKRPPEDKTTQEKLKPIEAAIQKLQQGNMSALEANAVLSEAREQLKREQEQMAASDKVQEALKKMEDTKDLAQAGENLSKAQAKQAQGDQSAAAQRTNAEKNLATAAQEMADKVRNGSDADRKKIADQLRAAAAQAQADPQLQRDLQGAASAADSGDANKLASDMNAAGQHMAQQQADQQQSQESLRQAMSQIDRMQDRGGGGQGSQSSMANSGGQNGNQGGQQGGQQGDQGNQGGQGNQGDQGNGQGQNQGGQQGGQMGNGMAAGQNGGQGGGQENSGSTMMEAKGGPGGYQAGGPIGARGTFVRIYDERQTNAGGSQEKVGSRINPLAGPANGTLEVMGKADEANTTIGYSEALPAARQKAMDELNRQEIPPQYRDMIKAFYDQK